jgi:voltage-gated potassium channel
VPFVLARVLSALRQRSWALPAALITFVFLTSWPLMWLAEGDAPIVHPQNYWWYFLVTCSTVGYGDFFPATGAGRAVGVYVIVGGIGTLTTLFAQLALVIERAKGRRMKGTGTIEYSGHVAVLGYTAGRTERLIEELLADGCRVVLCTSADVDSHPMAQHSVDYIRGDLTDSEVLRRAGLHRAQSILVDARDDNEALSIALTVAHVSAGALTVVALRDLSRATQLSYVDPTVRCVQWHSPRMLTEELQSPGISEVYTELMTHGGENTYSITLPDKFGPIAFGDCQTALGKRYQATVLAARTPDALLVSPGWTTPIPGGSTLYYVSRQRLATDDVVGALKP